MSIRSRVGTLSACSLLLASAAMASSHREAPAISKDPYADNTDTYVFVSPSNPDNLVLVASWIPFEAPEGGPNYFEWDDSANYYIHIDNDGDGVPNWSYKLESQVNVQNPNTFLYNTAPIGANGANWNRQQTITVTEIVNNSGSGTPLFSNRLTSPVNIGSKSTPNYGKYITAATQTVNMGGDEIKVFAGQTDDPFFVDLQVFDLLTLRGQAAPIGYSSGNNTPIDSVAGRNVHTMVIELPISRLTNGDPVLGVWSTTTRGDAPNEVQVSRLGMPLVNEVVIPMGLKDTFNAISPDQDLPNFSALQQSVEDPELGTLLCALYGVPLPGDSDNDCKTEFTAGTPRTGRGDIFDIYLTGMVLAAEFTINTANGPVTLPAGFNVNQPANVVPAEMIRINTNIKGDLCAPEPHPLGVLGGDACGFPNGRRLADDATDISLLAVGGAAYGVLDARDSSFSFNSGLIGVLSDNVNSNDQEFSNTFPYVAAPVSGQERKHPNPRAATSGSSSGGGGSMGPVEIALLTLLLLAMVAFRRRQIARS